MRGGLNHPGDKGSGKKKERSRSTRIKLEMIENGIQTISVGEVIVFGDRPGRKASGRLHGGREMLGTNLEPGNSTSIELKLAKKSVTTSS